MVRMGYLSHETTFDFGVDGEVFEDVRFIDIFLSILNIVGDTFLLCSRGHLDLISVEYAAPGTENTLEEWGINIFYTPPDIPPQITPKTCNCSLGNESLVWGGNIHGENQQASQPASQPGDLFPIRHLPKILLIHARSIRAGD
jgi:hypothetical protein